MKHTQLTHAAPWLSALVRLREFGRTPVRVDGWVHRRIERTLAGFAADMAEYVGVADCVRTIELEQRGVEHSLFRITEEWITVEPEP